jgi:hypothetical protein
MFKSNFGQRSSGFGNIALIDKILVKPVSNFERVAAQARV